MTSPGAPAIDLAVTGGSVLTPLGWVAGDVTIAGGRIVSAGPNVGMEGQDPAGPHGRGDQGTVGAGAERAAVAASVIDVTGHRVVPGFVDLQCNGAVGVDLAATPERLWEMAAALPRWGVTAWLPTIVSGPPSVRARALAALRAGPPAGLAGAGPLAWPLGLHLEGPFLAPDRRGAHPAAALVAPDPGLAAAEGWVVPGAPGVALVTLAPELPGALAVVSALVAAGVAVAAGHSSATAAEARAGIDAGIGYVTHLFNAMVGLHHRAPGLVGVALSDDRVRVGLIADGVHVAPAVVAVVARALGPRLSLVSDAVAALGTGDAAEGAGVRLSDGLLAGATVGLDGMVRNLMAFAGVPLEAAVAAVSTVPAGLLGLADRGVLAPGAVADLVVLDGAGRVTATVVGGVPWVRRPAAA